MIADQAQREEALDPSRSFIVQAPAGSGKTGLLVQRVLRLLSLVEKPESVVAITFTRKAASEMRARVVEALNDAADSNHGDISEYGRRTRELATAVLHRDEEKGWKLRESVERLQIQTIDSLCASITRQMPILSEFGGIGEVVEEPSELYLSAVRETLKNLAEGDDEGKSLFGQLASHFDNDISRLEAQVVKMLGKRDQWEHLTPTNDVDLVRNICAMLRLAERQLRLIFQRAGKVDFVEIARAARLALGKPEEPSDLLYSLDYRLQHLLIDEFQDTSRTQYELIRALTEQWSPGDDHTLFLVGDPMQSIYRFREADVGLFLRCWEERQLGAVQLTPLALETNFRSTPKILDWVEKHIGPLMPEDDKSRGAVGFRESSSGREAAGSPPRVVALTDDRGSGEADEVIRIIRRAKDKKVGILVRSRRQTEHILPALRGAGIAYQAVNIELLQDQQHIMDVISLTRALVNTADRVAWLACLRAPWCGLTLADLAALCEGKSDRVVFDLISDFDVIGGLPQDGRDRVIRFQEVMAASLSRLGRVNLRQLVERTWQELGGLAALQATNQREDVGTLLSLIEDSEDGGSIRDFSLLDKKLELLYARPGTAESHVSVMTIYEAKGLEFEVVILPQLGRGVRGHEKELLVWTEQEDEGGNQVLALAVLPQNGVEDAAYAEINEKGKERDDHEARRLFYVACTRAKDELYLIGSAKKRKDGTPFVSKGTFLHMLWEREDIRKQFEAKATEQVPRSAQGNFAFSSNSWMLHRLSAKWTAPEPAKDISMDAPPRSAVASAHQVSYHWVGDTSRHVGTVVHEVLKRITMEGLANWPENRIIQSKDLFESELARMGVPSVERVDAAKRVIRALTNTMRSERGRWILGSQVEARSEWAIGGVLDGRLVSGTVDRFFRDADGVNWIIDFKNSEAKGGQRQEFLAAEKAEYQSQLEQYAAFVSGLVEGPISLGLYFPLLDGWVEWQFTRELAAKGSVI